jgi:hypothetical protein
MLGVPNLWRHCAECNLLYRRNVELLQSAPLGAFWRNVTLFLRKKLKFTDLFTVHSPALIVLQLIFMINKKQESQYKQGGGGGGWGLGNLKLLKNISTFFLV